MAPMKPMAPKTPWGFQRILRPALIGLEGVARVGGPRRWWLLGAHAPGVSVFFDDDDSIHVEVCVMSVPGTNAHDLGIRIQKTVVSLVNGKADMMPAAVDVVIVPGI
jgi:uncharacterized alkaline shock family protein YloU